MSADLPDVQDYLATWDAYNERRMWADTAARANEPAHADVARRKLSELPAVSPLEALTANQEAVRRLIAQRWFVMRDAREAGATWEAIGAALGITKQGAQDYYRRAIASQEQYVAKFHDSERSRSALLDP
jgi:hypothetical protein